MTTTIPIGVEAPSSDSLKITHVDSFETFVQRAADQEKRKQRENSAWRERFTEQPTEDLRALRIATALATPYSPSEGNAQVHYLGLDIDRKRRKKLEERLQRNAREDNTGSFLTQSETERRGRYYQRSYVYANHQVSDHLSLWTRINSYILGDSYKVRAIAKEINKDTAKRNQTKNEKTVKATLRDAIKEEARRDYFQELSREGKWYNTAGRKYVIHGYMNAVNERLEQCQLERLGFFERRKLYSELERMSSVVALRKINQQGTKLYKPAA